MLILRTPGGRALIAASILGVTALLVVPPALASPHSGLVDGPVGRQPRAATPTWAGEWSTDWGTLTLAQSGSTVTGRYTYDSGRVEGTASGGTVTGRWSESPSYAGPTDAGTFTWSMSADGAAFRGTWTYEGGVGGGSWVGNRIGLVPEPADTSPPEVTVSTRTGVVGIGQPIPITFSVSDDSGKARWHAALYSGGTRVSTSQSNGLVAATGAVRTGRWSRRGGGTGPFYTCVWAEDAAGNTSVNAPMSSCAWSSVQVPVPKVSNGCGTAALGETVETVLNWAGDIQTYGRTPVNIRQACNQHDAGYSGATVAGIDTRKATDYRTWSRSQVDQKFYNDIVRQCRRSLRGPANVPHLQQCKEDAVTYVGLVRGAIGRMSFDADVTVPSVQPDPPGSTVPPGGARVND